MGLSLWIIPNSKDSELIQEVMSVRLETADDFGRIAQESYPKFYPHITLASLPLSMENSIDSVKSTIAKIQAPPTCKFASVDVGSEYYRSVYVAIQLTAEINTLHERVHEELNVKPRTPSFPHLSLCYIANIDAESSSQREKYRHALEEGGMIQPIVEDGHATGVSLGPKPTEGQDRRLDHFVAHEIWAVLCEGPVESWVVLRKFSLPNLRR